MNLLKTENLSKSYKMGEVEVQALKNISVEINGGQFVVVLGPSGSGKSTLLNLLGGMDASTKGTIWYKNEKLSKMNERELTDYRRKNVGFVFQFYNLMSSLTAAENIELAAEISDNPFNVSDILKSVNIEERSEHFPSQMSGGEQQRVAIARAVVKNPDVLLCDEPTGALDYSTGKEVLKVLRRIHTKYGKTVVIITHNEAISNIADRVIKLGSGTINNDFINDNPVDIERIEW